MQQLLGTWHAAATTSLGLFWMAFWAFGLGYLISSALLMHYGFSALNWLPEAATGRRVTDREFFAVDYTLGFNALFLVLSAVFLLWRWKMSGWPGGKLEGSDKVLFTLACVAFSWLTIGAALPLAVVL
jgi:hypothetical protein